MRVTDGGWTDMDSLLSQALTIHEWSKCSGGCGHYVDEAHTGDHDGGFEVREVVCHACAARDQWQRDHGDKNRPEPGTLTWVQKLTARPRKKRRGRSGA